MSKTLFIFLLFISVSIISCTPGGGASTPKKGSGTEVIAGALTLQNGKPAKGVTVELTEKESGKKYLQVTNEKGLFSVKTTIDNVEEGEDVDFLFSAKGVDSTITAKREKFLVKKRSAEKINLSKDFGFSVEFDFEEETLHKFDSSQLTLDQGGIIVGRVTANGRPLSGVIITSSSDFATTTPSTNDDGVYTLHSLTMENKEGELRFTKSKFKQVGKKVTFSINNVDTVNVEMVPEDILSPENLTLEAKNSTGEYIITVKWDSVVHMDDLKEYVIYRCHGDSAIEKSKHKHGETNGIKPIFFDTLSETDLKNEKWKYAVVCKDTQNNIGDIVQGKAKTITITGDGILYLRMLSAGPVVVGNPVIMEAEFNKFFDKIKHIEWFINDVSKKKISVNTVSGKDTLVWNTDKEGQHTLKVVITDTKDSTFTKEKTVDVTISDVWDTLPSMPSPRARGGAEYVNGHIYFFTGVKPGIEGNMEELNNGEIRSKNLFSQTCWKYSIADSQWTTIEKIDTARQYFSSVVAGDNIYLIGGYNDNIDGFGIIEYFSGVKIYNTKKNSWSSGPPLPTHRYQHASCIIDSVIYVIGGISNYGNSYNKDIIKLDLRNGSSWEKVGTLTKGLSSVQLIPDPDIQRNRILIIGGFNNGEYEFRVSSFNLASNSIQNSGELKKGLSQFGAHLVGDYIYCFGGIYSVNDKDYVNDEVWRAPVSKMNFSQFDWETCKKIPDSRKSFASVVMDDKIVLLGGDKDLDGKKRKNTAFLYYPKKKGGQHE